MKIRHLKVSALLLAATLLTSSCVGSFSLFGRVAKWNTHATSSKFLNEIIFILISPAYAVCAVADALVLNTIEFWSGSNPMAQKVGTVQEVTGKDGLIYAVKTLRNGYEVTSKDPTKTYTRKMTYIDIPFLAHLAFGRDRGLQFFVHAGPQISFLISESETIKGIDMNSLSDTQKALYGVKIQNKFDYGIAGGGGVELRTKKAGSFIVEGRYYFALSDFYSTTKKDYFARAAHGTITIKLTYLFDLKK